MTNKEFLFRQQMKISSFSTKIVERAIATAMSALHQQAQSSTMETRESRKVIGRSNDRSDDFCGEQGKMWLYVGRVIKRSSVGSVRDYIRKKLPLDNDNQLEVEQLNAVGKLILLKLVLNNVILRLSTVLTFGHFT